MDSFELNKIAGALLASVLLVLGVMNLADILYHTEPANPEAYVVAGVAAEGEGEAAGGGAAEPAQEVSLPTLLANADVAAGEKAFRACAACHNNEAGAGAKQGPNLYGVVGRPVASVDGFNYSPAMKAHGGNWTFEELFHFIEKPNKYIEGTIMSFAGISKPDRRADLIAYLNTLGSNVPLPAEGN